MTNHAETPRCAFCRRPLPRSTRLGRPARYCKRSHRQRAYEARRRADRAALPEGHVVVAQHDLDRLHDRLYALEAACDDIEVDLADVEGLTASGRDRTLAAYIAALSHLREAAEDLRGTVIEPVTH